MSLVIDTLQYNLPSRARTGMLSGILFPLPVSFPYRSVEAGLRLSLSVGRRHGGQNATDKLDNDIVRAQGSIVGVLHPYDGRFYTLGFGPRTSPTHSLL